MPRSPWYSRRNASERAAAQAWDYLTSAVTAAGDSAKNAGRAAGRQGSRLADGSGTRVGSVADEAWRRANAALDALAGRRPSTPWGLVVVAGVAGVAIGFAVAATMRTAVNRITTSTDAADLEPGPPPTTEPVHIDAE
jgi:hypothetical protein